MQRLAATKVEAQVAVAERGAGPQVVVERVVDVKVVAIPVGFAAEAREEVIVVEVVATRAEAVAMEVGGADWAAEAKEVGLMD